MIFNKNLSLDFLNKLAKDTMTSHIGITFTDIGEDYISASMPVDDRTKQSYGMLHGGANVVLAETLGSVAANFTIDQESQYCVGLEINANHLKPVKDGFVKGTARPVHIGKKTQVWEIKIFNSNDQLSCISRITLAVLDK
ncbi:hotdog fold thioesterase [Anditalea andensis]|uniref:Thioesterase n=1 Tax=Anditalea andensis TaxID=1048983 RepID=A0A074L297_9BACT|nr:hotdog fold thioesterase [Anditalea andensis]KEO74585.1 thioesterase [Anditalea andensis]